MALATRPGYITIIPKIYRPVEGSWLSQKDADVIGPEVALLIEQGYDSIDAMWGAIQANMQSPLRVYLTQDKDLATKLRQKDELRQLRRSLESPMRVLDEQGNLVSETWIRSFVAIKVRRELLPIAPVQQEQTGTPSDMILDQTPLQVQYEDRHISVPVQDLPKHIDYLQQIIADAAMQIQGWRDRHRRFRSLQPFEEKFGPIFDASDHLDGDEVAQ